MTTYASTIPAAKSDPKWLTTFAHQLNQTQTIANFGGEVDLLILGDSITEACVWSGDYQKHLPGMKILYYGIGGDQTQQVLWRIEHGLLNGIHPKFATLLIGVNNYWSNIPNTPAQEVAAGAIACGKAMREKMPRTKLLHFGVFSVGTCTTYLNKAIDETNSLIKPATPSYDAQFVDMRDVFLTADGQEIPGMLSADGVHLNGKAYDAWGGKVKELISAA